MYQAAHFSNATHIICQLTRFITKGKQLFFNQLFVNKQQIISYVRVYNLQFINLNSMELKYELFSLSPINLQK